MKPPLTAIPSWLMPLLPTSVQEQAKKDGWTP